LATACEQHVLIFVFTPSEVQNWLSLSGIH